MYENEISLRESTRLIKKYVDDNLPVGFTTLEMEEICDDILYPALPAPQNVSISDTTISFDEVEGATSYEVFADGVSIGEYEVGGE